MAEAVGRETARKRSRAPINNATRRGTDDKKIAAAFYHISQLLSRRGPARRNIFIFRAISPFHVLPAVTLFYHNAKRQRVVFIGCRQAGIVK
ncbi:MULTISPECIES: hypothetical protein [Enterobacteriaceae]|uniref:hypothetical protein n=1 Tax=Enterobacteriaceae TaxID=543 RepID=UPI0016001AB9|nr:hypothetical protein [Klebsiella sp. WP8-S18-ESBL-06]